MILYRDEFFVPTCIEFSKFPYQAESLCLGTTSSANVFNKITGYCDREVESFDKLDAKFGPSEQVRWYDGWRKM